MQSKIHRSHFNPQTLVFGILQRTNPDLWGGPITLTHKLQQLNLKFLKIFNPFTDKVLSLILIMNPALFFTALHFYSSTNAQIYFLFSLTRVKMT